jgi:hypothetical protein
MNDRWLSFALELPAATGYDAVGIFDKMKKWNKLTTCGHLVRLHDRNVARLPDQLVSGPNLAHYLFSSRTSRAATSCLCCALVGVTGKRRLEDAHQPA